LEKWPEQTPCHLPFSENRFDGSARNFADENRLTACCDASTECCEQGFQIADFRIDVAFEPAIERSNLKYELCNSEINRGNALSSTVLSVIPSHVEGEGVPYR
jgi:hypothetical protein